MALELTAARPDPALLDLPWRSPLEEWPEEAIKTNVVGTNNLLKVTRRVGGVERFVLISTDKTVEPKGVMGASKRMAEMLVQSASDTEINGCIYAAVRFGNVLGSRGSVVPTFMEQIRSGGPVTITDERMTRYFMSLHEAAELIVEAGALSQGGDIFLLEMGAPVKIAELAENMIRLAGLSLRSPDNPTGDIAIVETGTRPGEKLTEELFFDPANAERTEHPKILRSPPAARSTDDLPAALAALKQALDRGDETEVRRVLFDLVES